MARAPLPASSQPPSMEEKKIAKHNPAQTRVVNCMSTVPDLFKISRRTTAAEFTATVLHHHRQPRYLQFADRKLCAPISRWVSPYVEAVNYAPRAAAICRLATTRMNSENFFWRAQA